MNAAIITSRLLTALVFAFLFVSCQDTPPSTEVVLVINSELPEIQDNWELRIVRKIEGSATTTSAGFPAPKEFPATFGLYLQDDANIDKDFELSVYLRQCDRCDGARCDGCNDWSYCPSAECYLGDEGCPSCDVTPTEPNERIIVKTDRVLSGLVKDKSIRLDLNFATGCDRRHDACIDDDQVPCCTAPGGKTCSEDGSSGASCIDIPTVKGEDLMEFVADDLALSDAGTSSTNDASMAADAAGDSAAEDATTADAS